MNFSKMIGFGVAGNFTGHLEQAGESVDFAGLHIEDTEAPKGIFPFYLPNHPNSFLSVYPLSSDTIEAPKGECNLQMEPEVAIVFGIEYEDGFVKSLTPKYFGAYNDCSIRKEGAKKISEKKNWGANSKGVSKQLLKLDSLGEGCELDDYRIASFLIRDGSLHRYGIDSAAKSYSYFHKRLVSWLIEKMNAQKNEGPLECIHTLIKECGYPSQALISIGATRYTKYGESTYLQDGDEAIVILYPSSEYNYEEIERIAAAKSCKNKKSISSLYQHIRASI